MSCATLRRCLPLACMCLLAVVACGDRFVREVAASDASETSTTASSSTGAGETTVVGVDTSSETVTSSGGASSSSDGGEGCPFVCPLDLPLPIDECDLWAQNCPAGQKCMPWGNDRGNGWNAARCTPIDRDPVGLGEACMVELDDFSGIDDCEMGAMCWGASIEAGITGTCVGLCHGDLGHAVCEDPSAECSVWNDGFLILCLDQCDPVAQDCEDEWSSCIPGAYDRFVCVEPWWDARPYGGPCGTFNDCDLGLFCAEPNAVPSCANDQRCCSTFCDLELEDPDAVCPDFASGQRCVPWFRLGQAPPGLQHVGACMMPA